jgi:type III pantothenate kinase
MSRDDRILKYAIASAQRFRVLISVVIMTPKRSSSPDEWMALAVGNSRLHWAWFQQGHLQQTFHTPHPNLTPPQDWTAWQRLCPFLQQENLYPELWVASVVPSQTQLWQHYPDAAILEPLQVPLLKTYPSLGLDRAIALWSAGITYGWPVLVIDGGTALTLTGADAEGAFVGGAILPGLGLQMRSLQHGTAELPKVELPPQLPDLWANDTQTALQSGVVYGAITALTHRIYQWHSTYPESPILLTGGDTVVLLDYLTQWHQQSSSSNGLHHLTPDPHLMFKGISALRFQRKSAAASTAAALGSKRCF